MTTTTRPKSEKTFANVGAQFRWENVNEPGTYYSHWSGHLIRMPEESLQMGLSPIIEIVGKERMLVTKLSDDPYVRVTKARSIAANLDLEVNF